MHTKQNRLDELARKIEDCIDCKQDTVGKLVFGEGNPDAEIMFVGEAPGKKEAVSGRPFIGRSGKILRSKIRSIGLEEQNVYITSPVKYLPKRGTPSKKLIDHSRRMFMEQVGIINPRIIVLLGKTAITAVLEKDISVLKEHGTVIEKDNRKFLITLHPAAVLRFPNKYNDLFTEDFRKLAFLARTA